MNYSDVSNALNQASAFDLFRLRAAISRTLEEPERVLAIQAALRLEQEIEYFDSRANAQRHGTVLELRRKGAVIRDRDDGKRWLIEYPSINLDGADVQIRQGALSGLSRHEIAVGDIVGYLDRQGQQRIGKVLCLNDKTVSLAVGDQQWRVAYSFLHRVMEVDIVEATDKVQIRYGQY